MARKGFTVGMDAHFRGAAAVFKQAAPDLTYAQKVQRLYRHSLKTLDSWCVDRRIFNDEADKLRLEFDKGCSLAVGSAAAAKAFEAAEEKLFDFTHPDRYISAYMPGGSLYMRNPPLPLSVVYNGKENIPEGMKEKYLNVDLTQVTPGEKAAAGGVLVDASAKALE